MQVRQAFKYEFKPNGEEQRAMRRFAGSCRHVYNKALRLQQTWKAENPSTRFSYVQLANLLPAWKKEKPWLAEAPSQALQQSLKDLEKAYKNFFEKRAEFPQVKKKGQKQSFRYPDPKQFKIDQANSRIFLPKLGWIRYINSRKILGTPKNITVSCCNGRWFFSVQTEREVEQPLPKATSAVGIDVGITRFATLSNGSFIEPLNSFKKHQARLAKYQRAMSRKVKFSNNWKKAKTKVQKIHAQIANARKDFLHKASTQISKNHALIAIEDLQVKNMSASAKGNQEQHGKSVKAKSGLNRSILDQGWAEFRRQLDYKAAWQGGILVAVPPQHTSQTCPCCGHVSRDNRKTQARFECVECGFTENADLVGAINVLRRGEALLNKGPDMARLACQARDAAMSPATGTHRSDLGGLAA